MPILNYTTKIEAGRTVGELQQLLGRAGVASIKVDYEIGHPTAVSFLVLVGGRLLPFRLPADVAGVRQVMARDPQVPRNLKTEEQARRVAWRVVKDWVEAQMAFIESGQATLAQLFLPHAVAPDGRTMYQAVVDDPRFLLGAGASEQEGSER